MSTALSTRDAETKKPATRYRSTDVHVSARTIGTKINFRMPVINMSITGMLLSWQDNKKVPFAVNTILELIVKAEGNKANTRGIQCLAKVIHTSTQPDGRRNFGVKIIQSEEDEILAWNAIISQLEQLATNQQTIRR